jgi:peptide/nickel transport system substrate-binding protein
MLQAVLNRRRAALAAALLASAGLAAPIAAQAQAGKSALNLAMIGEPPTLDVMSTPADLVCIIMQHVYETLFTFDAKANLVPMLAETLPKVSADGKQYSITLRKGVKLHSGRELDAEDVVASLKRWM